MEGPLNSVFYIHMFEILTQYTTLHINPPNTIHFCKISISYVFFFFSLSLNFFFFFCNKQNCIIDNAFCASLIIIFVVVVLVVGGITWKVYKTFFVLLFFSFFFYFSQNRSHLLSVFPPLTYFGGKKIIKVISLACYLFKTIFFFIFLKVNRYKY